MCIRILSNIFPGIHMPSYQSWKAWCKQLSPSTCAQQSLTQLNSGACNPYHFQDRSGNKEDYPGLQSQLALLHHFQIICSSFLSSKLTIINQSKLQRLLLSLTKSSCPWHPLPLTLLSLCVPAPGTRCHSPCYHCHNTVKQLLALTGSVRCIKVLFSDSTSYGLGCVLRIQIVPIVGIFQDVICF